MKSLFIIDYESAHWCGGQSNVLVWAVDKDDAVIEASDYMEEEMRSLFSDEYNESEEEDNGNYDDESAVSINSVEEFNSVHEHWKYYQNPSQSEFYPTIGEPD